MTWCPVPELMWRLDPQITEARRHVGWESFHRVCGRSGLFFDHPTKDGKGWKVDAFTLAARVPTLLATGKGKTVASAVEDAYRQSGRSVAGAEAELDRLLDRTVEGDDFDSLIEDDFQELL